ncbi:MAG: phage adaptor protein [Planctomycetota bacterium]|jgi:hypothetical protein
MSTTTIQQNIIYGLGEGDIVADSTMLTYALRYANQAYRDIFSRYRFKHLRTRTIFRTVNGLSTYQAPANFFGFLTVKDESGDAIIDQVTPEYFAREISRNSITDESFTSDHDTAVSLANVGMVQYSETVTDETGSSPTTTYVRGTDYTMSYYNSQITVDSTGSMADSTTYYIDYLYRSTGSPSLFCLEFDGSSSNKYVIRMDPVPDAEKIITLVYPAMPSELSGSVEPIWSRLEYALERGGIHFGGLELVSDKDTRDRFERQYNTAIQSLVQMDQDLLPKHDQIPVYKRRSDYTNRTDILNR